MIDCTAEVAEVAVEQAPVETPEAVPDVAEAAQTEEKMEETAAPATEETEAKKETVSCPFIRRHVTWP